MLKRGAYWQKTREHLCEVWYRLRNWGQIYGRDSLYGFFMRLAATTNPHPSRWPAFSLSRFVVATTPSIQAKASNRELFAVSMMSADICPGSGISWSIPNVQTGKKKPTRSSTPTIPKAHLQMSCFEVPSQYDLSQLPYCF